MFSENTRVLRARRGSPEKKSVSPRYPSQTQPKHHQPTYIFQVLQKIGNSFALAVGENRFVEAIAGST